MTLQDRMNDVGGFVLETEPKVKYWVGDLCYVMHDVWEEACDLMFPNDSSIPADDWFFTLKDGRKFICFGTAHGDGEYLDQDRRRYIVDSGSIGAIRVDDIKDAEAWMKGGNIIEFPGEVKRTHCYYNSGIINISGVAIDTEGYDDDVNYDEEDEEY